MTWWFARQINWDDDEELLVVVMNTCNPATTYLLIDISV